MADIKALSGNMKLPEAWPIIDDNTKKVNADIIGHKTSAKAHLAESIVYSGDVTGAVDVKDAIDRQQKRIDNIVAQSGDDITEIVDARQDADGALYPTLKARMDTERGEVMSQLAETEQQIDQLTVEKADKVEVNQLATEKANKTEVNALATEKANKTELQTTNSIVASKADTAYVDTKIANIVSGSPKGTYATLAALQAAYPTGTTGVFVVEANGHWYYWSGSSWTDGGQYQSTGLADKSVATSKTTPLVGFPNINTFGEYIEINIESNKVKFPAGRITIGKTYFAFAAHEIDTTSASSYSNIFIFFNTTSLIFYARNTTNAGGAAETDILAGTYDILTRYVSVNAPYTLNGGNIANIPPYVTPVKVVINAVPMDFDYNNRKLVVSSCSVRIGTKAIDVPAHTVDFAQAPDSVNVFTIAYNRKTNRFEIYYFQIQDSFNGYSSVVATVYKATQSIHADFPITYNGVKYLRNAFGITGALNKPIDFQLSNGKIVIPQTVNIWVDNQYYNADKVTNNTEIVLTIPNDRSEMLLMFNMVTRKFEIRKTDGMTSSNTYDIYVAYFSVLSRKVFMLGEYMIDGVSPYADKLQGYTTTSLNRVNDEISQISSANKITFGYITDSHGYTDHIKAMVKMNEFGQLDFITHGGDVVYGETDISTVRQFLADTTKTFYSVKEPVFISRGNHDSDTYGGFTSQEWFNRMVKPFKQNNIVVDENNPYGGYFYQDFLKQKVRVIVTNSTQLPLYDYVEPSSTLFRWGWNLQQIEWIGHHALNLSDKGVDANSWQTLIFGHHPTRDGFSNDIGAFGVNGKILEGLLNAFNTGTLYTPSGMYFDFTQQGAKTVIAYIFGHTHYDSIKSPSDLGFPLISTVSSLPDYQSKPPEGNYSYPRPLNTINEDGWDVFNIDLSNKVIEIKRYGVGTNRTVSY